MERLGKCLKCNQEKMVRDHHLKGYLESNKDYVVPYCGSCDRKAHNKARKNGKCNFNSSEVTKLSQSSLRRRSYKKKHFNTIIEPNIGVHETIQININTRTITISSWFAGDHGAMLKTITEGVTS